MSKTLPHDHPDYEFPKEVHNLLVSAQAAHIQLSAMADTKASILMGAAFVVFTLSIGQLSATNVTISVPMFILGSFSFIATILSILAAMPKIKTPLSGNPNLLFFGVFSTMQQDEFVDHIIGELRNEETTYRMMASDLYQNGVVLQKKKYYYLTRAYQFFLAGLILTMVSFAGQLIIGRFFII